jgi:Uma2 family endonuclease
VRPDGLFTYPDVVVVCEAPQFADEHHDTLLNPTLIVEVLLASTRDYDRGEGRRSCPRYKFARYRTLDTLQEYVLVDQATTHVEHFVRQPEGGWLLSETDARADAISLAAIDCELPLSEIYHKAEAASRDE